MYPLLAQTWRINFLPLPRADADLSPALMAAPTALPEQLSRALCVWAAGRGRRTGEGDLVARMPLTNRPWKSADLETQASLSALALLTHVGKRELALKEDRTGRTGSGSKESRWPEVLWGSWEEGETTGLSAVPAPCLQAPKALCPYRDVMKINCVTCSCKLYGAFQKPKGLLIINQYSLFIIMRQWR